jgi:hypothetical protein
MNGLRCGDRRTMDLKATCEAVERATVIRTESGYKALKNVGHEIVVMN